MKKRLIVISLGGSLIVPDEVDYSFLKKFKKTLVVLNDKLRYKFVVVCGGGSTARKYISALKSAKKSKKQLSMAGIAATRMNAKLLMNLFGERANHVLPKNMRDVKGMLKKNDFVFCGALRFAKNETSDGTAAKLANFLGTDFINMTNVKGLYSANPLTNKSARFISQINWQDFSKRANKIKFKAGQHFVLDQNAAKVIKKKQNKDIYHRQKSEKHKQNIKGEKI